MINETNGKIDQTEVEKLTEELNENRFDFKRMLKERDLLIVSQHKKIDELNIEISELKYQISKVNLRNQYLNEEHKVLRDIKAIHDEVSKEYIRTSTQLNGILNSKIWKLIRLIKLTKKFFRPILHCEKFGVEAWLQLPGC
jgi:hypothetical protein